MAKAAQTEIRMRFLLEEPVAGVAYSLQDKKSRPVNAAVSKDGSPLTFEFPIRVADGQKLSGEYVRREGPERRFVYIAVGRQAGQHSPWSRRMKIDVHTLPEGMLDEAAKGTVLEGVVGGTAKDGTPACATVPTRRWRVVAR